MTLCPKEIKTRAKGPKVVFFLVLKGRRKMF